MFKKEIFRGACIKAQPKPLTFPAPTGDGMSPVAVKGSDAPHPNRQASGLISSLFYGPLWPT